MTSVDRRVAIALLEAGNLVSELQLLSFQFREFAIIRRGPDLRFVQRLFQSLMLFSRVPPDGCSATCRILRSFVPTS